MPDSPSFDVAAAHRYFSADCFNKVWELLRRPVRTSEEDEALVFLVHASIWHWTQRPDCAPRNMSIGSWQASRVYAVLGRAEEARRYGRLCLGFSEGEGPFYLGYAYESLARAEKMAGNAAAAAKHRTEAERLAANVEDPEDRRALMDDLATLA